MEEDVSPAAYVGTGNPDQGAKGDADQHAHYAHVHGDAGAKDQTAEYVASQLVSAKEGAFGSGSKEFTRNPDIRSGMGGDLPCENRHENRHHKNNSAPETNWLSTGKILQPSKNGGNPRWLSPDLFR